ncbi:MAG: hypothetical protein QS748_00840 [Candidatus Endonucleobacter bathymodioli]|uniref:Uncharacterized protein n=1 Tax=Candidatus Endonucleibacter bathymodioli TaxID=539814 RepID=A0AA90SWK9_9GAMM|nr:hypothetical protein [Candidatus Endonucleobacter bathymodioli]
MKSICVPRSQDSMLVSSIEFFSFAVVSINIYRLVLAALMVFLFLSMPVSTYAGCISHLCNCDKGTAGLDGFIASSELASEGRYVEDLKMMLDAGGIQNKIEWKEEWGAGRKLKKVGRAAFLCGVGSVAVVAGSINLLVIHLEDGACGNLFNDPMMSAMKIGAMFGTAPLTYAALLELESYVWKMAAAIVEAKKKFGGSQCCKIVFASKAPTDAELAETSQKIAGDGKKGTFDEESIKYQKSSWKSCAKGTAKGFGMLAVISLIAAFSHNYALNDSFSAELAGLCLSGGSIIGGYIGRWFNYTCTFSTGVLCGSTFYNIFRDRFSLKDGHQQHVFNVANDIGNGMASRDGITCVREVQANEMDAVKFRALMDANGLAGFSDAMEVLDALRLRSDKAEYIRRNGGSVNKENIDLRCDEGYFQLAKNIGNLLLVATAATIGGWTMRGTFAAQSILEQAKGFGISVADGVVTYLAPAAASSKMAYDAANASSGMMSGGSAMMNASSAMMNASSAMMNASNTMASVCNVANITDGAVLAIPTQTLAEMAARTSIATFSSLAQGVGLAIVIVSNGTKFVSFLNKMRAAEYRAAWNSQPMLHKVSQVMGPVLMASFLLFYGSNAWATIVPVTMLHVLNTCLRKPFLERLPPLLTTSFAVGTLCMAFMGGFHSITNTMTEVGDFFLGGKKNTKRGETSLDATELQNLSELRSGEDEDEDEDEDEVPYNVPDRV